MTDNRNAAIEYARSQHERYVNDLIELVKIPSVSTDPAYVADIRRAAEHVQAKLKAIGMENIRLIETPRHPVLYADHLHAGPDKPTVIIYGHYDVQPAEPLDLWQTPPYEPTLRDGKLYGRGASDMKGQVMASLHAVEAVMKHGGLPVNVKWLIEGEEEIGSPNLLKVIQDNKDLLKADFALNPDGGILGEDLPAIIYGLRGLAYFEVHVSGPDHDLHSGIYGGSVLNPAAELARLIAGMHDANGHITLPGFYDKVQALDAEERAELGRLPTDEAYYMKHTGVPMLYGEKGYTPVEHTGARPTLEVNGLLSGFTGEGAKTVLPAKAMAKISTRLVPNQHPDDVEKSLIKYMEQNARSAVTWQVRQITSGNPASITSRDSDGVKALSKAMETVWGKRPLFRREGGSVPVVYQMKEELGIDSVLTGFGLPDDNLHAPNEKLTLGPWYKGIEALIHFFHNL